ncbi:cytochrome c [Halomonas nitroreducens]|uniref:Cytochrome c domain-containing protein n=1 Tax=Halomonas nitroreducens TaxID=447425 RepID=A0A3S0JCC0_9GAMM|nr:cytochrome c [Halomonas nitroreducens]RTR06324.1 hypothetical protein EKG36_02295 [Halomonas nitroreducens]
MFFFSMSTRYEASSCRRKRFAASTVGVLAGLGLSAASAVAEPVRQDLPPKLQGLLKQEMIQIEKAMQEIYSAMLKGQHAVVAEKGQSIHDSFILEQSLTDEDRRDLKAAVPQEFLHMDAYLHELSASLAEAAHAEDAARQVETFGRMTEACVACHSAYVTDRFEGLEGAVIPAEWGMSMKEREDNTEG